MSRVASLILTLAWVVVFASAASALADDPTAAQYLNTGKGFYSRGLYFRAARYSFAAVETDPAYRPEGYAWVTASLLQAKLYNSASYFFIKTLQTGDRAAIRRVLTGAEALLQYVGADLLRKYLVRYTSLDDYNPPNRSALLYALGKDALLTSNYEKAVGYLESVSSSSPLWPYAQELEATARAIRGDIRGALQSFSQCTERASQVADGLDKRSARYKQALGEADDLSARCQAGKARTLYQAGQFDAADQAYDRIPKASIVWPDILYEQAWNSFARGEYNRTLGKLVSYKSPALSFVFNPETDVLRAQSYLALCHYNDANEVVGEFNSRYSGVGEDVKRFVEAHSNDLGAFYDKGQEVLRGPISSNQDWNRLVNRFIRGPYFTSLARADRDVYNETQAIRQFDQMQAGTPHDPGRGFPGFLAQVLNWRQKSIRLLGGMFVKNSLLDYHSELISNFEKISFIQLEMLKRAKDQLIYKNAKSHGREAGSVIPSRRDYQYYWSFNGEFWSDELGDYVFGLESQCRGGGTT